MGTLGEISDHLIIARQLMSTLLRTRFKSTMFRKNLFKWTQVTFSKCRLTVLTGPTHNLPDSVLCDVFTVCRLSLILKYNSCQMAVTTRRSNLSVWREIASFSLLLSKWFWANTNLAEHVVSHSQVSQVISQNCGCSYYLCFLNFCLFFVYSKVCFLML